MPRVGSISKHNYPKEFEATKNFILENWEKTELCKQFIRKEYVIEAFESRTDELFLFVADGQKVTTETLLGFAQVKCYYDSFDDVVSSATLDIICASGDTKYFLNQIEINLRQRGCRYMRLFAIPQRIIYFRTLGYIISHQRAEEHPLVKEHADAMTKLFLTLKRMEFKGVKDKNIKKYAHFIKNPEKYAEYRDFLKLLIRLDLTRVCFSPAHRMTAEPLIHDSEGYAMIKYL